MNAVAHAAPVLLDWDPGSARLVRASAIADDPEVVDSWLVEDGRARAVELHAARFSSACWRRHRVPTSLTGAFLADVMNAIPTTGRWFPRIELTAGAVEPRLRLRLRSAPARSPRARLWVHDRADPRREPRIKGPDLAAMHAIRARARRAGADEALLLGPDGMIREGAFSAILWWRAETLYTTSPQAPVLDSVTRKLLLQIAAGAGQRVRFEAVTPSDLDGLEVWSVGALHGIRAVTGWADQSLRPGGAARADEWNLLLEQALRPLPS